ncbi:FGGY family carbohydrate kinase [Acetobacteraceae bacterium KSS8]|uniref:FGGY family carbohydrate kinase n=1 Tax=Endosaccharibacter trunci TaxID=2812733 RepID=A0ABT1WAZ1_9PROT|nr:FGGY family carbohydrate kinase [Acetobacteraceae bacterium KSS8]
MPAILAIDQGTSATKCALIGADGTFLSRAAAPLGETHPQPGWVEQDPRAIWRSVEEAVAACMGSHDPGEVVSVGFSVQRESVLLWDRDTGEPVSPLVSWQDQRGAAICDRLRSDETEQLVRQRTGLPLDPMFSAAKATWLLDRHDPGRNLSRAGRLRLGTVDSWLLSRFGGPHVIEAGCASRTQLMNVQEVDWDDDLLALFDIPRACLPAIAPSSGPFPALRGLAPLRDGTPVSAVLGDSHAALFGHGAVSVGQVKATFGTGSSVMGLVNRAADLPDGLCLTIGWMTEAGPAYAAEGNIRSSGATLRWLASILDVEIAELVRMGLRTPSSGVMLVPGFGGLGAPWWDRHAIGLFAHLSLGTTREQLARAAVDSIVFQIADVVDRIGQGAGAVRALFVDGGPARNDGLVQLQADRLGCPVLRAAEAELSALGAAHLAGLGAGLWDWDALRTLPRPVDRFEPKQSLTEETKERWHDAVDRARSRRPTEDVR